MQYWFIMAKKKKNVGKTRREEKVPFLTQYWLYWFMYAYIWSRNSSSWEAAVSGALIAESLNWSHTISTLVCVFEAARNPGHGWSEAIFNGRICKFCIFPGHVSLNGLPFPSLPFFPFPLHIDDHDNVVTITMLFFIFCCRISFTMKIQGLMR